MKEADVKRSKSLNSSLPPTPSGTSVDEAQQSQSRFRRWWEGVRSSLGKRLKRQGNWMEETHGTLMVVATMMATMAFQVGISPPGGDWQQNIYKPKDGFNCSEINVCEVGTIVLSSYPDEYLWFLYFNSTSFFASLCVILLVVTGFPIRSKFFIWLLTLDMLISVASMTLTYIQVLLLLTSKNLIQRFDSLGTKLVLIWIGSFAIVVVIHIIRLLHWIVKKLIHIILQLIYWMLKMLCNFIDKLTRSAAEDRANV
jgi:hypothetical protein